MSLPTCIKLMYPWWLYYGGRLAHVNGTPESSKLLILSDMCLLQHSTQGEDNIYVLAIQRVKCATQTAGREKCLHLVYSVALLLAYMYTGDMLGSKQVIAFNSLPSGYPSIIIQRHTGQTIITSTHLLWRQSRLAPAPGISHHHPPSGIRLQSSTKPPTVQRLHHYRQS